MTNKKTKLFFLLKNSFFNISDNKLIKKISSVQRVENEYLEKISGGKLEIAKKITKPFYYTGYGLGYTIGKIPIIGYTVYHSIKDAIIGFYDAISNNF